MTKKKLILKLKYILILCYFPIQAWSFPYNEIYVFGDSLSDTGRLFEATGVPPAPYSEGRSSNGKVWVEYLAGSLYLNYNSQTNFAWAGATTGTSNVRGENLPGLQQQIDTYVKDTSAADSEALYVVWAGANDFLSGVTNPEQAVTNLVTTVTKLRQHGAQHILVPHMPDLGKTPRGLASDNSEAMTELTLAFNKALANNLQSLEVIQVDIPASLEMITSPETITPEIPKLTNVTEACLDTKALSICETPYQYLYWDDIHPTTTAHKAIALVFYAALAEPVYFYNKTIPIDAVLDIPLIGNVLGATMSRVLDDTRFDLILTGRSLQTATVLQNLISFPSYHQSPSFDPSTGILHLPIVHLAEVSLGRINFIAKYTANLSLVPDTLNNPFRAPLFVLTSAALVGD